MVFLHLSIPIPLLCLSSLSIEKIIQPVPTPASRKNNFFFLKIEIIGSINSSVSGRGIKELLSTKNFVLLNSFFFCDIGYGFAFGSS